ncbi:MAG TPA: 3-phosphoshikimate 1-carboxyvinyltransferase [Clostridia bacterium]|nr:3-phosphoshikimate 1-carboxyvinyltransferase [Clostridia bacterium]
MLIENRNTLRGEISVPGDKSISHRAIVTGALARGTTEIDNFLLGEDCISTIECFRKMQVGIEILQDNRVRIQGRGLYGLKAPTSVLNTGRSGTAIRLLLGVLSGQPFTSGVIRNEAAMKKPVGKVVSYLKQMGANISGREDGNLCPLTVSASSLKGTIFELSALETHIKSPLLFAGLYAHGDTVVREAIKSRDHTELMLNYFGADVKSEGLEAISHPVENLYAQHVSIPGDISMASYFITAALLVPKSDIVIRNVGINPTRTGIIDIYRSMGAKIEFLNEHTNSNELVADIHVVTSPLIGIKIEPQLIPNLIDELPIIITAAALAKGTTEISGLSGFKVQESGKLKAISLELSKMGAKISETEDGIVIEGREMLRGTVVESNNNHSLAMALSIAGLAAEGETMIRKTQAVDIVYPGFFETLNKL